MTEYMFLDAYKRHKRGERIEPVVRKVLEGIFDFRRDGLGANAIANELNGFGVVVTSGEIRAILIEEQKQ